jgi:hypothetical protein
MKSGVKKFGNLIKGLSLEIHVKVIVFYVPEHRGN